VQSTGKQAWAAIWGLFLKNLDESRVVESGCFCLLSWLLAPRLPFSGANVLVLPLSGGTFHALVGRNRGFRR
jgi:hypothetical protein